MKEEYADQHRAAVKDQDKGVAEENKNEGESGHEQEHKTPRAQRLENRLRSKEKSSKFKNTNIQRSFSSIRHGKGW